MTDKSREEYRMTSHEYRRIAVMITQGVLWLGGFLMIAGGAFCADEESRNAVKLCVSPNLFIDDYLIAESRGLKRTTHQPKTLPEPVITRDDPTPYVEVLHDPVRGCYRMWYNATGREGDSKEWRGVFQAYAESADGIAWQTPDLGLVSMPGKHPNNAIDAPHRHFGLFLVDDGPGCADPALRYKLAWFDQNNQNAKDGMCVAFSSDGLRFREHEGNPVMPRYGADGEQTLVSDAIEGCWDPMKQQYIAGCKVWGTGYPGKVRNAPEGWRRTVGIVTSKDFITWEGPRVVLTPDPNTMDEFNNMKVMVRGNLYIGFLHVLRDYLAATPGQPVGGIRTTELATSRDGIHWTRHAEPFCDRDPRPGAWNHAMADYADSIIIGDKEYVYITGYAVGHKTFTDRSIGMGFLRKDGFVSRDAGPEGGLLKTPPAALPGEGLTVNAVVRGELKVRLVDGKGKALPGFDWQDCIPVRGDSVAHRIGWRGEPALPTSEPVSLEFSLHDGELYAFDFAPTQK